MEYTITQSQAAEIIEEACTRGARPITVTLVSEKNLLVKSRKDGEKRPFPSVRKVSTMNGIVNFDYTKAVNRKLKEAGLPATFESGASFYHFSYKGKPTRAIVTHKTDANAVYLRMKPEKLIATTLVSPDDEILDPAALEDFLPIPPPKRVDKPSACATLGLDNIQSFTLDGNFYKILRRWKAGTKP